jgi:putative heme iron utilization protein
MKFSDSTNRVVIDGNSSFLASTLTAEKLTLVQAADPIDPKIAIQSQINTLEEQQLLPRITREFMLSAAEAQAQAAGVDPNVNVGYRLLKQFDNSIASLRAQL